MRTGGGSGMPRDIASTRAAAGSETSAPNDPGRALARRAVVETTCTTPRSTATTASAMRTITLTYATRLRAPRAAR